MKNIYKLTLVLVLLLSVNKMNSQMGCLTPSLGIFDGTTFSPLSAVIPCTYTNVIDISPSPYTSGNQGSVPCIRIIIGLTNPNAATNNSIAIGEGANNPIYNLCPSACSAVIPNASSYTMSLFFVDPAQNHGYNLCNTNAAANMNYTIASCYSSVPLSSGVWNNSIAGGCQTVTIPANSPIGLAGYTVSPAVASTASVSVNTGDLFLDPLQMAQGIYTISYSFNSQSTCSIVTTRTISITNPYSATWTSVGPFCSNNSCVNLNPQITGTSGGTFTAASGVTSNSFCPSLSGAGTFPVTYTVGTTPTCGKTATNNIVVNAAPSLTISNTSPICIGNSTSLIASGASTFTWNTGPVSNSITVSPTTTTTYSVTGTNIAGCQNTKTTSVIVNPLPIVTASTPSAVCAFSTACLTSSGAITYNWAGPCGFSSASANPCFPASGFCLCTYTVFGTDANGCLNTATVCLNVVAPTIFTASTTNSVLCVGQTATLTTSNGSMTYTWSTAATGSITTVSPTTTTTYSVDGTNSNGCITGTTITQTVSTCAGINQISIINNEINIFPNPANEQITVSSPTPIKTIKIFSVDGKLVLEKIVSDKATVQALNISQLNRGIYLMKCVTNEGEKDFKVVKE